MKPICSNRSLSALLRQQLKPGVVTNAALSASMYQEAIETGCLFAHSWSGGLLLLQLHRDFQTMHFYLQRDAALPDWTPELPTVLEIAARPQDVALRAAVGAWQERGFRFQFTRQRMTRQPGAVPEPPKSPVLLGTREELPSVLTLLSSCFDPKTGCLPSEHALEKDLSQGQVLLIGKGQAVLQQAPVPGGSELRHLAVTPALRRQGLAQSLVSAYLLREGGRISRVWVRQDNDAAKMLYQKNGYLPDCWTSQVLLLG